MSQTVKEERLRWVLPIVKKEVKLVDSAKVCPYGKRTLERWVSVYKREGEKGLVPKSTEPKRYRKETPIRIKERIIEVRKSTGKCALKIHWHLEKEGASIHARTVGKILKKEGVVRKYRTKKVRYKYIRAPRKPGELVEIDVKYVPGKVQGKRYFQYTAIDTASRWRYMDIYEEQSTYHSICFLKEMVKRFPHRVQAIKTDNHSIFTNRYNGSYKRKDLSPRQMHALDRFCAQHNITHYLIDPGKPSQNGTVERSHREDQEKFYAQHKFRNIWHLQKKLREWNVYYNDLEHCGLNGKTPNEFLEDYQLTNPPNVCA